METDDANSALPFVRQFHRQPSTYLWDDELGNTQVIPQGEDGEQGDHSRASALLPQSAQSVGGCKRKITGG